LQCWHVCSLLLVLLRVWLIVCVRVCEDVPAVIKVIWSLIMLWARQPGSSPWSLPCVHAWLHREQRGRPTSPLLNSPGLSSCLSPPILSTLLSSLLFPSPRFSSYVLSYVLLTSAVLSLPLLLVSSPLVWSPLLTSLHPVSSPTEGWGPQTDTQRFSKLGWGFIVSCWIWHFHRNTKLSTWWLIVLLWKSIYIYGKSIYIYIYTVYIYIHTHTHTHTHTVGLPLIVHAREWHTMVPSKHTIQAR